MTSSTTPSSSTTPPAGPSGFGGNEWLVDELYQAYLADRSSVDEAWWEFFADYTPAEGSAIRTPAAVPATPPASAAAPAAPTPATAPASAPVPAAKAAPKPAPAPAAAPAADTHVERLRGPAARVVDNMEASLTVPTATSVRDVPAKLLIDNRTVINNHLARGRGGKVSFTHMIGFAIVLAAKQVPAMNFSFTELDGKPAVAQEADVNLGLAIDVTKPDGSRTLLVPNIKGAQDMDFAAFWGAYEDVVRRARNGSLEVADFAGTTIRAPSAPHIRCRA